MAFVRTAVFLGSVLIILSCISACSWRRKREPATIASFDAFCDYHKHCRPERDISTATITRGAPGNGASACPVDVPVPLLAQPCDACGDVSRGAEFFYACPSLPVDVSGFYEREMVLSGWRSVLCVSGAECMLVFEKPDRQCVISIRPAGKKRLRATRECRSTIVIVVASRQ